MAKVLQTSELDQLFQGILKLETVEECYSFFEDLCTMKELQSLGQRMEVAKMLRENATYMDVVKATGASTATISRVNRAIQYGNDGYEMIFKRIDE